MGIIGTASSRKHQQLRKRLDEYEYNLRNHAALYGITLDNLVVEQKRKEYAEKLREEIWGLENNVKLS